MIERVKLFIEKNIKLLDKGDFEKLYDRIDPAYVPNLTKILLDAHIDPLPHMEHIPSSMYERLDISRISTPSNIESIGLSAFHGCVHLKSAVFASGLAIIEDAAFLQCLRLKRIVLPDTLQVIGELAFMECPITSPLVFPSDLTKIKKWHSETVQV